MLLLSFAIRRLLRRAALFLWITPFEAALSSSEQARRTVSTVISSLPTIDCSARLTSVLTRERTFWFRTRLRSSERMCFFAESVLAKGLPSLVLAIMRNAQKERSRNHHVAPHVPNQIRY